MRPPFCSAVVLSLCLSLASVPMVQVAGAEPAAPAVQAEKKLAVLPLRVDGQVDAETRERWTAGLREGLGRGEAPLADPAQVTPYVEGACDRESCYERVRANSGATHLVRATLVAKNRDFLLKLDLVDAKTGAVVFSNEAGCEICGSEEVVALLDSQGVLLQTRLAAMDSGPAVLVLATKPNGAVVYVDGEVVGTTPLERPVIGGSHRIRVSLEGYVAEERELTLVNGAREELSLTLMRTPGDPKSRALGAAGLAGGLAVLGAGVVLAVLDDLPYRGNCKGGNVDADMDCKFLYGTGPLGAALIGVGAILGTIGAVALHRNRGAKGPAGKRAAIGPRGFGVGGSF